MSCQQLGDECKSCIFCAPGSEILLQIYLSPSSPPLTPWNVGKNGRGLEKSYIPLYIGRPCCYINYKYIKFKWLIVPKLLASYIQYEYTFLKMYIRARWNFQCHYFHSGRVDSYVKLNFKGSLFSCVFWFEDSLLCKIALLVFGLFTL